MQFLKTLFWVMVAVVLVLFARANWDTVTIDLWGGLQADVKLPVLLLAAFVIGFLPTFIIYRTRVWGLKRRIDNQGPAIVANAPGTTTRNSPDGERLATDSKVWPTA